jgi:hypothetical protein
MSVRVILFFSLLVLLFESFLGLVLLSALPCFILIPYRYPVYFLDLFLDLSYAIDPSSDSVHGLQFYACFLFTYLCSESIKLPEI